MSLPPLQIPLLDPPRPVTALERERYEKNLLVPGIGEAGQARLLASRVLVIGAGGLGSPVLLYLAAAGVGTIGIADPDGVAPSNLQRQIIHCEDSLGSAKSHSAATRLAALNSSITVETYGRITLKFLHEHGREWDLLVDCTDTFDSKYLIADWCKESGVPLVWGTVVAMNYQVASFWSAAPPPTSQLPSGLCIRLPPSPEPRPGPLPSGSSGLWPGRRARSWQAKPSSSSQASVNPSWAGFLSVTPSSVALRSLNSLNYHTIEPSQHR